MFGFVIPGYDEQTSVFPSELDLIFRIPEQPE
jgi:hypothetical protein